MRIRSIPWAHLGLASLELKAELVHHWRVVDENRRLAEWTEGGSTPIELRSVNRRDACAARRSGLFGQQPLGQLLLGHFEAEDRNRFSSFQCRYNEMLSARASCPCSACPPTMIRSESLNRPSSMGSWKTRSGSRLSLPALHLQRDPLHRRPSRS